MVTENTSFPAKGSPKALNSYRRKGGVQIGNQSPTMVTEERSFPPNGSSMVLNGYRGKEFSAKWVINGTQWLPRKGVFVQPGHQSPSMVTENTSFPAKGSPKALNSYRGKGFSTKPVINGPHSFSPWTCFAYQ